MFERYTEKARRTIFFARYEASQFGSPEIETEHLLLGLLREDKALTIRFLRSHASMQSIRKQVEARTPVRKKVSTTVDLPLSQECKRVLGYAAEEAERLAHKNIGTEHLLLGLLREEKSFGAQLLRERGLSLETGREELMRAPHQPETPASERFAKPSLLTEYSRDLTQAASEDRLDPLIGREAELERVVQILCRRSKNNPLLIGEPGVGKSAIVEGLAQRIAEGNVPERLATKRVLALDVSPILAAGRLSGGFEQKLKSILEEWSKADTCIGFIEDSLSPGGGRDALDVVNILRPALVHRQIQCIGAAAPEDYEKAMEKEPWLAQCFHAVKVSPPTEEEAIKILFGIKGRYEKFHAVTYTDEALQYAVRHSSRYIPGRHLPDKAIDLIDEAGASVMSRKSVPPEEVIDVQKRLRFVLQRMENAIANHEFEKARFYANEERKERENLRKLRAKHGLQETTTGTVTLDDLEQIVARWTGVPLETIRRERASPSTPRESKP